MDALGRHLLMELEDCNEEILNNLDMLRETLMAAADEAGATVVTDSFHRFSPHGISGVVVVAESHLFIHTWPEYGYAAADIFTCGTTVQPEKAAEVLIKKLGARKHSIQEIARGTRIAEKVRLG
ncbi:MAG TPA: adenosylmethionine decarboxylase [Dehalococcoidia bacterium]|nr:adenosylmethionine decarboxylase [Dehalococcoidia bacterium]